MSPVYTGDSGRAIQPITSVKTVTASLERDQQVSRRERWIARVVEPPLRIPLRVAQPGIVPGDRDICGYGLAPVDEFYPLGRHPFEALQAQESLKCLRAMQFMLIGYDPDIAPQAATRFNRCQAFGREVEGVFKTHSEPTKVIALIRNYSQRPDSKI